MIVFQVDSFHAHQVGQLQNATVRPDTHRVGIQRNDDSQEVKLRCSIAFAREVVVPVLNQGDIEMRHDFTIDGGRKANRVADEHKLALWIVPSDGRRSGAGPRPDAAAVSP